MKRVCALLLCLLGMGLCLCAMGEEMATIDLGDRVVTDWDALYAELDATPDLARVDMYATVVEKAQMEALTARYPGVAFGCTLHLVAEHYVRTDATAFSTLHGYCRAHSTEDLEALRYCTQLEALDLGHNYLTDLSFLTELPHLKVLILGVNPFITDITPLAELRELEYLELFSCDIRDITPLMALTALRDLNLCYNTNLRDLDTLCSLSPTIERLWVSHIGVGFYAQRSIDRLQEAYPNAVIVTSGEPTEHGWRVHDRYDTIYRIFHSGVYEPFE